MFALRHLVVASLLLTAPIVYAHDQDEDATSTAPVARFVNATINQTEQSLVAALESDCPGMWASAAQTIRDLKAMYPERSFESLVIPLMRIVKDERCVSCSRIVSALALHELRAARGDFAITRTGEFTDCPRMRHLCRWLTYARLLEDHPELAQKDSVSTGDFSWMIVE